MSISHWNNYWSEYLKQHNFEHWRQIGQVYINNVLIGSKTIKHRIDPYLDMLQISPMLTWCEFPMIQSVRYSTSLLRNFISCLNVRSSRRSIIASTSWHSLILIWMAWTVESRCLTYLRKKDESLKNGFFFVYTCISTCTCISISDSLLYLHVYQHLIALILKNASPIIISGGRGECLNWIWWEGDLT